MIDLTHEAMFNEMCCPNCGPLGVPYKMGRDDCDQICSNCGDTVEGKERPAGWISVAVFTVEQMYGGPEEGGWYYNEGEVIKSTLRCFPASDLPVASQYYELLLQRYFDGDKTPWDRFTIRVNAEAIEMNYPKRRPHYC